MKKLTYWLFISSLLIVSQYSNAQTPNPPNGKKWEKIEQLSDEFNGNSLNTSKWIINDPQWEGRRPARFEKSAVAVANGKLRVTASKKSNPSNGWTHNGGLVRSKIRNQYGYYEARMKANKTFMSSTFWLINKRNEFTGCDLRVTELDVTENVGVNTGGQSWIDRNIVTLNANTHSRRTTCNSTPVGIRGDKADIGEPAYAGYHTYGVWWKNAREILFYLDGRFVFQITPAADFSLPMYLRMVVETYDWNPPKAGKDGMNNSFEDRTTKYDWVRSYKLVDDDGGNQNTPPAVSFKTPQNNAQFTEGTSIIPEVNASDSDGIANVKLYLNNELIGQENQAPYQWASDQLKNLKEGTYSLKAVATDTRGAEGSKTISIKVIADSGNQFEDKVSFKNAATILSPANSYTFDVNYEASTNRELVVELWAPTGWLGAQKETVAKGSGTKQITVNLPSITTAGSGYILKTHIRPVNSTWREAIDRDQIDNVTVQEEVTFDDQISFNNPSTTINPADSYTFDMQYSASKDREIVVSFWKSNTWIASKVDRVTKGSGNKMVKVTLPSPPTPGTGYLYKTHIRPIGSNWQQAIDTDQVDNVTVASINPQLITNGTYFITGTQNDQNVLSRGLENHSARMHNPGNYEDQKWIFNHLGDNVYTIKNKGTNRYLEVPGAGCGNGKNVATWTNLNGNHKKWKVVVNANGVYGLKPMHCLSKGMDRAAGAINANVQLWDFNASNENQKWKITAVSESKFFTKVEPVVGLYPNPSKDFVTIAGHQTGEKIIIYNLLGTIVKTTIAKSSEERISISDFKSGVYIVSIGGKSKLQLIKE